MWEVDEAPLVNNLVRIIPVVAKVVEKPLTLPATSGVGERFGAKAATSPRFSFTMLLL
jgi:hypothetical protein